VITRRTVVPADTAQLCVLSEFMREFGSAAALAPAQVGTFALALEEIFTNIVMHGSRPGSTPAVEVSLCQAAGSITMTVEDDGPEFDPLSLPPPDVTAGLLDRRVGGLGVFLVRKIMDNVSYARIAGRNQLCMSKGLDGHPRAAEGKIA
jgi:anti-sigma regulatory factor (Ser/Thr protein kinase)